MKLFTGLSCAALVFGKPHHNEGPTSNDGSDHLAPLVRSARTIEEFYPCWLKLQEADEDYQADYPTVCQSENSALYATTVCAETKCWCIDPNDGTEREHGTRGCNLLHVGIRENRKPEISNMDIRVPLTRATRSEAVYPCWLRLKEAYIDEDYPADYPTVCQSGNSALYATKVCVGAKCYCVDANDGSEREDAYCQL